MEKKDHKISVIMGIYNCAETLEEALESIEEQTYDNWEIIMCDDGSIDNTLEVAQKFAYKNPDRTKIICNKKNLGLNKTLNKCLEFVQGDFIARQDGDDISLPTRFEKEICMLINFPEYSFVSCDMNFFDESGIWGKTNVKKLPDRKDFLKGTPFCHGSCMIRKEAYDNVDGYSVSNRLLRVEDYHLWIKMYEKGYKGINIQEPLYLMRDDRNAIKRRKFKYRLNESYVKALAVRNLNLPIYCYGSCLKPLVIGLLPSRIYTALHRIKQNKKK